MNDYLTTPIDRAIAMGDRDFRELAEVAPTMIWRAGTDAQCDWFNQTRLDFTGRSMAGEVGDGWTAGVHPDDLDHCLTVYRDAFGSREPFSMEYRMRRQDGEFRWILDRGTPYDRHGAFAGYWGCSTDISEQRDAQRAQRVLINELNHRVKNTLAVVQAMAMQSFRRERPLEESMRAFDKRLIALARAHDLLVAGSWEAVSLHELIGVTVAPHDPGGERIVIGGPALMLRPETATAIAMAVHELFTNAAKYGALSTPRGTVSIAWTFDGPDDEGRFQLAWAEDGGPPVHLPVQRGFGTRFIEKVLAGNARGKAAFRFEPGGVHCVFEAIARRDTGDAGMLATAAQAWRSKG